MLSAVRERQTLEPQASSRDEIGLIGPTNSGATGLVWSLLASGSLGASPFAAEWRLEPAASPDPGAEANHLPRYLNPYWPQAGAMQSAPAEFTRRTSTFAIAPISPSGWPVTRQRKAFEIIERSELEKIDLKGRPEPGWAARAYDTAPHVVWCHPMDASPKLRESYLTDRRFDRLVRRIEGAADGRSGVAVKTLAVAFTRYDQMFVDNPRGALARALDRDVAQGCVQQVLQRCPLLRDGLRRLKDVSGLRIIGIPVSTFGFVPGDGRPNYDPWLRYEGSTWGQAAATSNGGQDEINAPVPASMLTRPDIYCELIAAMRRSVGQEAEEPSGPAMMDWLKRHWRPFLTADPFVACVSGETHEFVFDLADLLEQTPMREAAYR